MREFYVYHNWRRDRAVVHHGACRYCRFGVGAHTPATRASDEWLGPFEYDDAFARARTLRRFDVAACRVCSPRAPQP
ncbi:MAG TPA: hypothetical protein VL460_01150 [Caulobacteraceae bacterium]|nr:hypothetical protein [Caulobacteraceae bacterium]